MRSISNLITIKLQTKRNVALEGKSGGKQEIDVLAEKSDGVTTTRIMQNIRRGISPSRKMSFPRYVHALGARAPVGRCKRGSLGGFLVALLPSQQHAPAAIHKIIVLTG